MGVFTYTQEFTSPISPSRMFKAMIINWRNMAPKLMPQFIKSIDIIEGDGGAGSIEKTNFTETSSFKCMKHRIDEVDKENFVCKYTLIEGDELGDKLEKIAYEVKFEASVNGCIVKMKSKYYAVADIMIKEVEIKARIEKAMVMYKAVENYLFENPHVYD